MESQDLKIYTNQILSIVSADKSGFGKALLTELEEFLGSFDPDESDVGPIQAFVNFQICCKLYNWFITYLNNRNLLIPSSIHRYIKDVNKLTDDQVFYSVDRIFPVYTSSELLVRMRLLDAKAIKRVLGNCALADFDKAYDGISQNNLELFSSAMEKYNVGEIGSEWFKEFLMSNCFKETCAMVLVEETNQELFYDLSYTRTPEITSFIELIDSHAITESSLDLFFPKIPLIIGEIKQLLNEYLIIPELSQYSKRYLNSLLSHYDFIFLDCKEEVSSLSSENLEAMIQQTCHLVDIALDRLDTSLVANTQVRGARSGMEDNINLNKESEADDSKVREFVAHNFRFENTEDESYFMNNYLTSMCRYISSISNVKDFQTFCYLIFPFNSKQKNSEDTIRQHLTGKLSWVEEPKNIEDCAHRVYTICDDNVKVILKGAEKIRQVRYDKFKTYTQKKLRTSIADKALKREGEWMIKFLSDYWPEPDWEHATNLRGDVLREYEERKNNL